MGLGQNLHFKLLKKGISIIAIDHNKEALDATAQRTKTETKVDTWTLLEQTF